MEITSLYQHGSFTFQVKAESASDRAVVAAFLKGGRPDIQVIATHRTENAVAQHLPDDVFLFRRRDADLSMEDLETASETREEMEMRHRMEREAHDATEGLSQDEIDALLSMVPDGAPSEPSETRERAQREIPAARSAVMIDDDETERMFRELDGERTSAPERREGWFPATSCCA
jgi:hypothetical protein